MIKELWEAGWKKRLERKIARVCFHVLSVNIVIKNVDQDCCFWTPISDDKLDQYFGHFAWNDWFFNEFKTKPDLDPSQLLHYRGHHACRKTA